MSEDYITISKEHIDELCRKYDIVFKEVSAKTYKFFIKSPLFNPSGWIDHFEDGYFNSFVELKQKRENHHFFYIVEQSKWPVKKKYWDYYMFDYSNILSKNLKEFDLWIEKTVDYVHKLPLIERQRKIDLGLTELEKDFV